MANSWGEQTWGYNDWGQQDVLTIHPTGFLNTGSLGNPLSYNEVGWGRHTWGTKDWGDATVTVHPSGFLTTGSLGNPLSYNEIGWGRSTWGSDDWGDFSLTVVPSSLSMTASLGEMVASSLQGWGRAEWGNEPWGDSNSPSFAVGGFGITASLGTLAYAQSEEGWGRDEWGYGNWGQNTTTVPLTTSFEMSGHMGPDGWGEISWGNSSWGGQPFVMNNLVADAVGITGFEATGSLGTPTINYDFKHVLTQSLLGTLSRGSLSINNGADHTQGLGGLASTMSLGTLTVADVVFGPTTFTITGSVTPPAAGIVQRVSITGLGATLSLGSLGSIPDMAVGLTALQATGSLGTITPADMVIGLTGFSITGSINPRATGVIGYKDVDITGYTSYTDVTHAG